MTGKEWHQYAKREEFKTERGSDAAWGGGMEIWLDGTDVDKSNRKE
jgi:glycyl-tRNA synthetase alpha subunit